MRTGMLWFDNDKERDVTTKLRRAVDYYKNKYGQYPNLCYIHPSMSLGAPRVVDGVSVASSNMVLPHHFWLGVDDEAEQRPAA
jgi:hypothetical protein